MAMIRSHLNGVLQRTYADTTLPVLPALCWAALWGSINTGPGNIDFASIASGWAGAFNGIRATFPLIVLMVWILHLLGRKRSRMRAPTPAECLWLFYGIVSLIASVGVMNWFSWSYSGLAFLATLGAVEMYIAECDDRLAGAASLNRLSWIIAAIVLALIVKAAGSHLVEETKYGLSGYTVNVRIPQVAGMPMVRSTGIARFAAAIGIVAFVAIWRGERRTRLMWLVLFALCAWLVWVMQGRGSTVAFIAGIGAALVLLDGRARIMGLIAVSAAVAAAEFGFVSHDAVLGVWGFATRHDRHLEDLNGRVKIFHDVWRVFWNSPIIGYGPQADHRVAFGNAQNGLLYALLCGGVIGGGAWILGFAISLMYLARAALQPGIVRPSDLLMFAQVAGLMVFFTLRTIPENTSALFSVDLMLQLPAIVYLGELMRAAQVSTRVAHAIAIVVDSHDSAAMLRSKL